MLTAFAAGSVDVIGYTRLGGIFASAMTGNVAFLGLYIAEHSLFSAIGSFIALFGFVAGGAVGTLLTREIPARRAIDFLLGFETILLAAACLLWFLAPHRNGLLATDVLILMLAMAMGLQSICGKKINLSNIPTVVFTSTLTNIVIAVTDGLARGQTALPADTKRQLASFFAYLAGALAAGLLTFFALKSIILLPFAAALAASALVLNQKEI